MRTPLKPRVAGTMNVSAPLHIMFAYDVHSVELELLYVTHSIAHCGG